MGEKGIDYNEYKLKEYVCKFTSTKTEREVKNLL